MIERGYAIIVEFGSDCAEYRQVFRLFIPSFAVALNLFSDITHRIFTAAFFKFVDYDQVGIIQHVNFFKLRRRAELAGHHVHRNVSQINNVGIALTDTRSFGNHQIKSGGFDHLNAFSQGVGDFCVRLTRCQRAHIDFGAADSIHADSVAQQCTAGLSSGRIATDNCHMNIIHIVNQAQNQFICERGFSRPARSGDADNRHLFTGKFFRQFSLEFCQMTVFHGFCLLNRRDGIGNSKFILRHQCRPIRHSCFDGGKIHRLNHVIDNALKP